MSYIIINRVYSDTKVVGYDMIEKETNRRLENVPIETAVEYTKNGLVENCEIGIYHKKEHIKRKRDSNIIVYKRPITPMVGYRVYNKRLRREEFTTLKIGAYNLLGRWEYLKKYTLDLASLRVLDLTEMNSIHWQAQMMYDINTIKKTLSGKLLEITNQNKVDTEGFDVLVTYRDTKEAMRQIQKSLSTGDTVNKEGLIKIYVPLTDRAKAQFKKMEEIRIHTEPDKDINIVYDMDDVLNNLNEAVFGRLGLLDELKELKYFDIRKNEHCLTSEQMTQVISEYSKLETFEKTVASDGIERIVDVEKIDPRVKVWIYTQKFSKELNKFTIDFIKENIPGLSDERIVIVNSKHKKKRFENAAIIVEDSAENIAEYGKETVKILIDKPYNRHENYVDEFTAENVDGTLVRVASLSKAIKLVETLVMEGIANDRTNG